MREMANALESRENVIVENHAGFVGSTKYNTVGMALYAGVLSGGRALFFDSDELVSVSKDGTVAEKDMGGIDKARE